ncbi:MAG: MBG domain-containing protein, partial [Thermomonas sp.]
DVGNYPINGIFTSAAGYRIQLVPGNLGITPATLFFTADGALRYLGTPNPPFSGTVTGFRNGDTVTSVFGSTVIWSSPAGLLSPVGFYAVNGGSSAKNYVFSQAPGNATAFQIIPLPQLPGTPTQIIRETVDTYVYDRNFGSVPMCALNASLEDQQLASKGDELSAEWSKVRSRPNLTNCFESERRNSCGDF